MCVWLFVCVWRKKNNFSDPFASPLNLHAIFSHLEWGGMHHPMLFLFSFLMSHAFFFFISSFPFIVWSSGAVYFWIFFGRLFFFEMRLQFVFFWTKTVFLFDQLNLLLVCLFFFLNLGDAKNWQQKERKKKWVHRTCGHSHVTSRIFSPSLNGTHTHTWKGKKKSLHTEKEGIF